MYVMRFLILLLSVILCNSSFAQWYESQGSAVIIAGDKNNARTMAMENAVKKALLVAGASVSSVQQVVNGLITQDELSVRASGTINSIDIVDEIVQGDTISVTVRADIFPQEQQCFAADYKKSLLVTRANLINREQANIGQIYNIDKAFVNKLASTLNKKSQFINIKLANKSKTAFSRYNKSFELDQIKSLSMELGKRFDTQFVLFTEINDISFGQEVLNSWQFWQEDKYKRYFNVSFYLYSALSGELLAEHQYENQASWQFGKRNNIDLNSDAFWTSSYGQMLNRVIENTTIDMDESMMCEQTRAKIVKVSGNEIVINVGKNQGVKLNDDFSLLHTNHFKSEQGKVYSGFNISPYKVKVTKLYKNTAIATTPDKSLLGNIQVNDLAVKQRE